MQTLQPLAVAANDILDKGYINVYFKLQARTVRDTPYNIVLKPTAAERVVQCICMSVMCMMSSSPHCEGQWCTMVHKENDDFAFLLRNTGIFTS